MNKSGRFKEFKMIYYQFPEAIIHCSRNNSSGFMHLISIASRKWDEFVWASTTFTIQNSTELWPVHRVHANGSCHMILAALEELLYMIAHLWVNYNLYILIKYMRDHAPEQTSTAVQMKNRRLQQKIVFLILRPKQFSAVWVRDTGNAATFS